MYETRAKRQEKSKSMFIPIAHTCDESYAASA